MVYVVGPEGGPARPVPIELGAAREGLFEVRGQLAEGDLLVVRGNERLRPMQPVRIVRRIDPTAAPTQAAR
jgi:multidrug efflux pump subunit AcrA (membrane-fusion protein)